ncbi:MAG: ligand-binding sensor domain-containing protein [Eubacteriales bacterium]
MKIIKKILIIAAISGVALINYHPLQSEATTTLGNYLDFEKLTTEQGLSQNCVTSIIQDHYGYLWIGTMVGLNKYDGINFKIYLNSESAGSISNSCITHIYETKGGQIWIGTAKGLNLYSRENDTLSSYFNDHEDNESISNDYIRYIYEDSNCILWIGTEEGLNCYNQDTNVFTAYKHNPEDYGSISNNGITCIYEDSYGVLWIGTKDGLNIYNKKTCTFCSYLNDPRKDNSISNNNISKVYEDSKGMLWIGTANGLNLYNRETDTFTQFLNNQNNSESISSNTVTSICEDIYGYLWIGTRSGLNKLDTEIMSFTTYSIESNNPNSINSNRITCISRDNEGSLWIGTVNGVNKLNPSKQLFKYYTGMLTNNTVSGICSLDGIILWMETRTGIIQYNIETDTIENYYPEVLWQPYRTSFVMNLFGVSEDGCLWGGTENSGLYKFNPSTYETSVYNYTTDNSGIISNSIISLYISPDGIIWIGTDKGLCSFDSDIETFNNYRDNTKYPDAIKYGSVWVTYQDSNNNLWFGTKDGIYMLNDKTKDINLIHNNFETSGGLFEQGIYSIYEDSRELLWFGTNRGLLCYDPHNSNFISYDNEEVLINESILSIIEDSNGDIWFTTRKQGLWLLSLQENTVNKYGIKDGLQNDAFCVGAYYKANDGQIYLGCIMGLISFNPDQIKVVTNDTLNIFINYFSLLDQPIAFDKPIEDMEKVKLHYSENSFEINFIALNYYSPGNNKYAYILEGFDENWHYCNANETYTRYTNIPTGEYTFRVKASNSNEIWTEEGVSLKIIISAPFWQQWWFIAGMVAIAILLVYIVIKFRTYTLQKYSQKLEYNFEEKTHQLVQRSEQLENELRKRAEFTRALAHELKTPLTPLLSSSEFLMGTVENDITLGFINNIRQGILNLEKRINDLMDLARGEVGLLKLNCDYLPALNIIKESIQYFLPEAQRKNQGLILDIPDTLPEIYADSERLRQVILNLLNNASKFTRKNGEIILKAREEKDNIIIEVIDNGCGIDKSEQEHIFEPYSKLQLKKESSSGLGLGLYLAKLFIELHEGQIWVISSKGKGSAFVFSLPLRHNSIKNYDNTL